MYLYSYLKRDKELERKLRGTCTQKHKQRLTNVTIYIFTYNVKEHAVSDAGLDILGSRVRGVFS